MCFRIHQRAVSLLDSHCSGPRIRTSISGFRAPHPAVERTRNVSVVRRTARGSRTLTNAGLSRGPLPFGLERHAISPGGRGRTCTATPHQSVSSTTWIPLGRAGGREPDGRGRRDFRRCRSPTAGCAQGLVEEVTPCLRIARSEPPRGLEPRPPHYERGVLPVELRRQEYGENHMHEEGLLLCH